MGVQESIYRFIIVFLLPVFGFVYFFIDMITNKFAKGSDSILKSYLDYIKEKNRVDYIEGIDFEKEINVVPMEDSLIFNENKTKRSYLIHILKKGFASHVKGLKKALVNDDTETSHYAAAALMEIKNQFELMIQSASEKYERNKGDVSVLQEYVSILKKYLNSSIPDKVDYYRYLKEYSIILEKLLSKHKTSEVYFTDKISCDIKLGDYDSAGEFCKRFLSYFPNSEKPYLALMKLKYFTHNYKAFTAVLNNLKKADFNLSERAKSIINFCERIYTNVS
jgi:tetratricopeptide (TPR) repeat protein